ncbi:MAG: hypothetical protein Q8P48_02995 [Deltaproteobacteria bacterium]|nr:hypothetical protein [Deltaproteobacteria bacterium]
MSTIDARPALAQAPEPILVAPPKGLTEAQIDALARAEDRRVAEAEQAAVADLAIAAKKAAAARKAAAKESAERRERRVAADSATARRHVAAFEAHRKVGNVGGMRAALRDLRNAQIQRGACSLLGGAQKRDDVWAFMAQAILEAEETRKASAAKRRK